MGPTEVRHVPAPPGEEPRIFLPPDAPPDEVHRAAGGN